MTKQENTILYVDDEELNLILFEDVFKDSFDVITTTSTINARELLKTKNVKVLVTDLKMPNESGLDFIRNISPQYPELVYIVLTAYTDIKTVLDVVNQGVIFRYLLKPWKKNEILFDLNNACNAYDLKSENLILINELKHKTQLLEKTAYELKEREKQFFNIFNSTNDAILLISKKEQLLLANPVFYQFTGLMSNEIIYINTFLHGKQLEIFRERLKNNSNGIWPPFEYEFITPKGEKRFIEANSTNILFFGEEILLSVLRDITERKQISQNIFNAMVEAEDIERKRIASDLHDGLGPILSTLKMYIEWLTDSARPGNREQVLDLSNKTIEEAINQLRSISYNLSPHVLDKFGLMPAIQNQLEMVKTASKIDFSINSDLKERLEKVIEMAIYRALKECINNTIKHAEAKKITLNVITFKEYISVIYTDDGKGFNTNQTNLSSKGMGLYNICNRIKSIGGEIEIESNLGKGTSVQIKINI